MRFRETGIPGAFVVELEPFIDERGMFARIWCADEFADAGLTSTISQCSISSNPHAWTLRGMHYQTPPHEEAKLVRCTRGAVFDVVLDLREGSGTFGKWFGIELNPSEGAALFIPEGCAHGFQTIVGDSDVLYMISRPYAAESATGVRYDDPAFGIEWPRTNGLTISDRDRAWPDYFPPDAV